MSLRVILSLSRIHTHTHTHAGRQARSLARSALAHIHPCTRMRFSFRVSPRYLRKRWPPRKRTVVMLTLSFAPRSRHVLAQRKDKRACVRGSACAVSTVSSCIEHRRGRRTDRTKCAITRVKVVPVRSSRVCWIRATRRAPRYLSPSLSVRPTVADDETARGSESEGTKETETGPAVI